MLDNARVLVNNLPVEVGSYSADSDLFYAADAFSFTAINPQQEIHYGMPFSLWVNNKHEMRGVINKVESTWTKKGLEKTVQGRDLMGILCDHKVTEYGSNENLSGMSLKGLALLLMKDVPFILPLKDIIYEGNAERLAIPWQTLKSEPGQTVFEILRICCAARGLNFWQNEDGKLVFGKPVSTGKPAFHFVLRGDGSGNVITSKKIEDDSASFSKIFVYSQSNDDGDDNAIEATASLNVPSEFPYYKPEVIIINTDAIGPGKEAKRRINASKAKTLQMQYTVKGHSQDFSGNFRTNLMARVDDDMQNVHEDMLLFKRTFSLQDKKTGPTTTIHLCRPGAFIDA